MASTCERTKCGQDVVRVVDGTGSPCGDLVDDLGIESRGDHQQAGHAIDVEPVDMMDVPVFQPRRSGRHCRISFRGFERRGSRCRRRSAKLNIQQPATSAISLTVPSPPTTTRACDPENFSAICSTDWPGERDARIVTQPASFSSASTRSARLWGEVVLTSMARVGHVRHLCSDSTDTG